MTSTPARTPSAALLASLRRGEGLRLHAYPDPISKGAPWTIGYGHTAGVREGDSCTKAQAEAWLVQDAQAAINTVLEHLPWSAHLDAARFDALVEMAFNLGWPKLQQFGRTLNAVAGAHYGLAADRMLDSAWADQVGDRAQRLAEQMRSGAYASA